MTNERTQEGPAIALIGFGEVGTILAEDFGAAGCPVAFYDLKLEDASTREALHERAARVNARAAATLADALRGASLVFSVVTADQSLVAASAAATHLKAGQTFIDMNSVSPQTKQASAARVEESGAAYVEAAVMAPVPPQRLRVPVLLGGASAGQVETRLNALGMRTEAVADTIGYASAVKLCRSIMIKGMEALCVQSMLAARQFGAHERVLASLHASFPGVGWDSGYEGYLIGRVLEHGKRRSEEMREAAAMLEGLKMDGALANSIADVQAQTASRWRDLVASLDAKGALPDWERRFAGAVGEP
jgi:3-hydroxyisobutyrate dehydrogenase-like beta-hydroxyacid dehydrogenase